MSSIVRTGLWLGLVVLLCAWPALAQSPSIGATLPPAPSPAAAYFMSPMPETSPMQVGQANDIAIWPYLLQLMLVTSVLAGMSYFGLRFIKEKMPGLPLGLNLNMGQRSLRIVERVAVDAKRLVFVVNVGERYWLVGATEDHITPIAELSKEDMAVADFAKLVEKETPRGDSI